MTENILINTILLKSTIEQWEYHIKNVIDYRELKIQEYKNLLQKKRKPSCKVELKMKKHIDIFFHRYDELFQTAFRFNAIKNQTRYHQKNYVRTPYTVVITSFSVSLSPNQIETFLLNLSKNGSFDTSDFHKNEQRKLMTAELRNKIKLRDNRTCQLCGFYMPNEVGLQIDHIIPIAHGGKPILIIYKFCVQIAICKNQINSTMKSQWILQKILLTKFNIIFLIWLFCRFMADYYTRIKTSNWHFIILRLE